MDDDTTSIELAFSKFMIASYTDERINAVVAVFCGMVIENVFVAILSEPKSKTAIDLLALLEL
jgi:hypothetical protein